MQTNNDINEALRALREAAKGRAFFWNGGADRRRGWRAVERVEIGAEASTSGDCGFWITAYAADNTNRLLSGAAPKLVDALIAAHAALAALPLIAEVTLYDERYAPVAVNDAGTAPASEVA